MWKPFILCWLLSVLGPSHQGFVGKRHRSPSFEVTERTDTCIDVQWDKHYFKTTGLRHFILRAIAMGDKKSVEYRFAAVARDGYLCELEPNTKYTISLIPVTISGTTPETFDLHNVLTLPAVTSQAISGLGHSVDKSAKGEIMDSKKGTDEAASAEHETETSSNTPYHLETITGARPRYRSASNEKFSSLAMRYLGDSVHISAEAEITDSTEGTGGVSTEGIKTATVSNSPSLFENITGAIPTVPSESNEKGFVGKRHRSPSFEVTERTDTCIDVQWDKHYFKTTGLRHFILRAIAMGDKKSVEYRFAAVARDGYLCELEPNTKYTISLIPVTISGTTPETFYLHNVLTLPAVASLAVSNLQDSVDNSAEAEITDSTEGTDEVSTEGRKTATLSNSPSLFENITGAIPTVPSESNEKVTSQAISGLGHSVDNSAEREITDSTKGTDAAATVEHETETSSNTPNHLETITGTRPRYRSESIEKVDSLAISNLGESVDNLAESEITDSTKGKDWVSTEGHGTETLANSSTFSKTFTGGSTRVMSQSDGKVHLGAFRQKGIRPAALVVTVCVILSLLVIAIGIIIWVARRSLGRRFNFKLDLVHAEENC